MLRRSFLRTLLIAAAGSTVPAVPATAAPTRRIALQHSPLAGFQYHEGEALWPLLRTGSPLQLRRESDNPHDSRAVAVLFMDRRIGYIPRSENTAISQLMDRGERLSASIAALEQSANPWRRVRVAVELTV
jgi:hypothetical protein